MVSDAIPNYEVVMATFNGERFIIQQLDSIASQTIRPSRIIINDDCSCDNTVALVNDWKSNHDINIKLTVSPKRQGYRKAFAAAFLASKSDYIMPSDQDDLWRPDKAKKLLSTLITAEEKEGRNLPVLVHSDLMLTDEAGITQGVLFSEKMRICPELTTWQNLAIQNVATGCALLVNRACLTKAMPIPDAAVAHDWWLALVAKRFGCIHYIPEATVAYRQHDANAIGAKSLRQRLRSGLKRTAIAGSFPRGLITPSLIQLQAFATRFKHDLTNQEEKDIKALLDPSFITRIRAARRLRLNRHRPIETLAFYACLALPTLSPAPHHWSPRSH